MTGHDWTFDGQPERLIGRARDGAEKGLELACEHILGKSREDVPHEEGTLERSGRTKTSGLRGVVYYDTPYAVRQHEDLTLRHDAGRTAKYLEKAMNSEMDTCRRLIATAIRDELGMDT